MLYTSEKIFMEKYRLLDETIKHKLKTFLIEIKEDLYECNGLKVFYSDTTTFNIIYPLLQILCQSIQTLSIGGNSDVHPVSWTPCELIIPNEILFE
jgi:hypothetical protein